MPGRARRREIVRAVRQVDGEGPVPLGDLVGLSGASVPTMIRWAMSGKGGVRLEAIRRPGQGWVSSPAAVLRFQAAVTLAPGPAARTGTCHPESGTWRA